MTLNTPLGFARSAKSRSDPAVSVPLRITHMNARDAWWWDRRLFPFHSQISQRADRHWSWTVLLPVCHLIELAHRRYCRPLVVWAPADNGQFMRVAMSLMIEGYPHLDVHDQSESHFVWFISAADDNVLRNEFGLSHPPSLGRVLLDNAIVLSANAGHGGRIGLHAAQAGGDDLLALYSACGLLRVLATAPLPSVIHRGNDGRFFYSSQAVAEALVTKLNPQR